MSFVRDWGIAAVCLTLLIGSMFPESVGRVSAQVVRAYQIEMAKP